MPKQACMHDFIQYRLDALHQISNFSVLILFCPLYDQLWNCWYVNYLGAPLIIHPGRDTAAPFEIVDVLRNAGADLSRTVMSHLDRTLFDHGDFVRFAETGCLLEFDLFGTECSHYQVSQFDEFVLRRKC